MTNASLAPAHQVALLAAPTLAAVSPPITSSGIGMPVIPPWCFASYFGVDLVAIGSAFFTTMTTKIAVAFSVGLTFLVLSQVGYNAGDGAKNSAYAKT